MPEDDKAYAVHNAPDGIYVLGELGHEVGPMDRYAVIGLIGELATALRELWPENDPRWQNDPNRSNDSGTIGTKGAKK